MAHVRFGTVQKALKLQSIGVTVRDHIAHLADDCREYKYANKVADDGENVSVWATIQRRYEKCGRERESFEREKEYIVCECVNVFHII